MEDQAERRRDVEWLFKERDGKKVEWMHEIGSIIRDVETLFKKNQWIRG
jgi:hypothetical protein